MPQQDVYPHIHYLTASAGAGKTYQLTIRFLTLLAGMRPSADALRQIVAITFTNRAAAEMKERILLALKQIALGEEAGYTLVQETGLHPSEAAAWIDTLLAHFSDFHVRTIDSLVYVLLRAFSLEMGLRPELEVVFEQDTILDLCFDRLLSRVRWGDKDDRLFQLFTELLEMYLKIEEAGGLVVERGIRRRFQELYYMADIPYPAGPPPDLSGGEEEIRCIAQKLLTAIHEEGGTVSLNKRTFQQAYLEDPLAHLEKAFFEKASFEELLTSKAKGLDEALLSRMVVLYEELKEARNTYLGLLARAKVYVYIKLMEQLQQEVKCLSEREGQILGRGWHALIKGYLHDCEGAGAYAFMKLGSQVQHFLIDEFQDTSRPQWEALLPLLEESLSSGGSIFYVGDVKQAIYGWRGGDWRLFGEAATSYFPSVPPHGKKGGTLIVNYRSLPRIVEFNNGLYRLLINEQFAQKMAGIILGEKAQGWAKARLADSIAHNFADVEQDIAPGLQEGQKEGRVDIASFVAPTEELRRLVKQRLLDQVQEVWGRRKGRGIAVLVRRNKDAEDIAAWLVAEGIPVVTENSLRLRSSDLIKSMVAFLRFLDYPLDDLSFWGAIASRIFQGLSGISQGKLEDFISEGRWQPPLYKTFERRFPEVSGGVIRPLLAHVGFVTPYDLAREMAERFLLFERFPAEAIFIYRFFELIFQTEAKGQRSLAHFLQFWDEGGMEEKIGLPEDVRAVRVLTIHKAKGLEFPVVFIPFTNWRLETPRLAKIDDGSFVILKRPLPSQLEKERLRKMINDALESLNLLYVATTRAEEELYLYETSLPRRGGEEVDRGYLSAWLREMLIQRGYRVS
jgi:ATP-dependent exoDNAse (exonuclease V) beta subunit